MKLLLALFMIATVASAQWTRVPVDKKYDYQPGKTLLVDGKALFVGSQGSVYRSTDNAETFVRCTTGIVDRSSGCTGLVRLDGRIYASFGGNGGRGVYYSMDNGETWVIDTLGWPNMKGIPVQMFAKKIRTWNNTYLFALLESNYTIYKKPSDSQWTTLSVPSDFRTPEDIFFAGDTIFLSRLGFGGPVATMTTDMGATWTQINGSGATPIGTIWRNSDGPDIYSTMTNYVNAKPVHWLVRSTNNGRQWDTVRRCLNEAPACVLAHGDLLIVSHEGSFTAADSVGRIILSTDRGATWSDISGNFQHLMGFSFHSLRSLEIMNTNTLVAGVDLGTGILLRTIDIGTPASVSEVSGDEHTIAATVNSIHGTIQFGEPLRESFYTITDLSGRVMASGKHSGELLSIAPLPSGAYVLVVTTGTTIGRCTFIR
ncbi:MAG: hypothetical protein RL594_1039 [Bacteroidota bacterium]|jgi:photosystem II stability/assembly factor-like uncharacterized protein